MYIFERKFVQLYIDIERIIVYNNVNSKGNGRQPETNVSKATSETDSGAVLPTKAENIIKEVKEMSKNEILAKIEELKSLEELIAEAEQEVESIKDEIKNQMLTDNVEELIVGNHIVRWTTTLTQRFDSTAFKKALPEIYKTYTKQTTSRRFSIN